MTGGRISTKGNFTLNTGGTGPAKANYQGGIELYDFASIEKGNKQDLVKWKNLGLHQFEFNSEPLQVRIGEIDIRDFYSRLIIGPDGKINLQNLTTPKEETQDAGPPADGHRPSPGCRAYREAGHHRQDQSSRRQHQLQRLPRQTQLFGKSHGRAGNDFRAQTGSARRY